MSPAITPSRTEVCEDLVRALICPHIALPDHEFRAAVQVALRLGGKGFLHSAFKAYLQAGDVGKAAAELLRLGFHAEHALMLGQPQGGT